MDKYLEQVIPEEAWKRKFGQLCDELALVEGEIAALETAQDRFFETADLLLKLAGQLAETYLLGNSDRKRALLKLVASNATLEGGKARLNLIPTFQVLQKTRGRTKWWTLIRDLRNLWRSTPCRSKRSRNCYRLPSSPTYLCSPAS